MLVTVGGSGLLVTVSGGRLLVAVSGGRLLVAIGTSRLLVDIGCGGCRSIGVNNLLPSGVQDIAGSAVCCRVSGRGCVEKVLACLVSVASCGVLVVLVGNWVGLGDLLSEVGSVGFQSLVGIVLNLPE